MKNSEVHPLAPYKGKILALDFGQNNVGVAITDESQQLVFARESIKNFGSLQKLFEKIKKIYEEDKIGTIVFGLPLDENENLSPQASKIKKIGQKLGDYLGLTRIIFQDESFSSFEAREELKNHGIQTSEQKKHEDSLAAVIILTRYLKERSNE